MKTMLRHSLLTTATLMCLWTPSLADPTAATPDQSSSLAPSAGVSAKQKDGKAVFMNFAMIDGVGSVEALISAGGQMFGDTALMRAAGDGSVGRVKALIATGVDVNAQDKGDGETALMWAAQAGSLACVKALLAAGSHVSTNDYSGKTALMWAADAGSVTCVKALIAAGADVNAEADSYGNTALSYALEVNDYANPSNPACVKALIAAGADVNARDNEGNTELMRATDCADVGSVKVLIAAHAHVNAKNNDGEAAVVDALGF